MRSEKKSIDVLHVRPVERLTDFFQRFAELILQKFPSLFDRFDVVRQIEPGRSIELFDRTMHLVEQLRHLTELIERMSRNLFEFFQLVKIMKRRVALREFFHRRQLSIEIELRLKEFFQFVEIRSTLFFDDLQTRRKMRQSRDESSRTFAR